jgi:NAD(P)-dependent dehydrogenase (short-subunit alcohol dehydrogenase family)
MIARGFVEAGATVLIASRKEASLKEVSDELSQVGECSYVVADLSTEEGCRSLGEAVATRWPSLDVLVNNAGANWGAPLAEQDHASWARVLDVNVEGVFHTTKFLLPLLQAAGTAEDPARIINIGSVDGIQVPAFETYAYAASKAAVHQLTRHLAKHLAPTITVNAIAPGPFQSRMMRATLEAAGEGMAKMMPLKRIGRPDDMAGPAIFLASAAASFMTGTIIPVDGGIATTK